VLRHPRDLGAFLRLARDLAPEEIRRLTREAERIVKTPPDQRAREVEEDRFREGQRESMSPPRNGVADGPPDMLP